MSTTTNRIDELAARTREHDWKLLIGGQLAPARSAATYEITSPVNGATIATVPDAQPDDVDAAVTAAEGAWRGWAAVLPRERGARLRELASILRTNAQELAELDAIDAGMPIRGALADVEMSAAQLELFADYGASLTGETVPASVGGLHFTTRVPFGVVARIVAFNHPLMFSATKLAAPLVAGNAVVLKPADQAPLSALRMGELFAPALPPGVLSIIVGSRVDTGRALVRDRRVRRVGLIGSETTGRAIQRNAAETGITDVSLELGGKNAMIVFDDADIETAAQGAVTGMNFFPSVGQSCGSNSRLLVHEDIRDAVLEQVAARIDVLRPGDPLDPETDIGPVAFRGQYDKTMNYLSIAREEGATVLAGGGAVEGLGDGLYVQPTVLSDVTPQMRVAREEIFGPVLSVLTFGAEDEAVALANSLDYGLTGSVWTRDLFRAHRVAAALEAGYVWINGSARHFPGVPFGGVKSSGIGREESLEELHSYTQLKSTHVMPEPGR